jgi:lysyl-tRNA synthetase class 1
MGDMSEQQASNYWLDQIVDEALRAYPEGEITVSSGISPSASYHIGHFREALTADAIAWGLRRRGRKARHMHVVDNFDPLRKRYHFLPERFEQYVGWPICLVPDPFECHSSYATHYSEEFKAAARQMGVEMEVIYSYEDQYRTGKMAPYIEQAMAHIPEIRRIFKEVAHRDLAPDWAPIQILSDAKSFNEWKFIELDSKTKTLRYRRPDGSEGEMRYDDGRVKLNWRLDWPARWALHDVRVEPYGKEHATKGGSYDTGAGFVREVFGAEPPLPLPYDTINLVGDNKKMSSSLGNLVTPAQALEIMPPEILRFFVLKSLPKRVLYFDSGLGLYNLIDEFSKLEGAVLGGGHPEFEEAYKVAAAHALERTISSVSFGHLVQCYQAAERDGERTLGLLRRSGYETAVQQEDEVIRRELDFVRNWLDKYAPDSVKFAVQNGLPEVELSDEQRAFLARLAETVETERDLNGQGMHDAIYAAAQAEGLKPGQAFVTLYRVILGKDAGPKAGWFLAELDGKWLVKRLKLIA